MKEKLFQWKLKRLRKRGERYKREYEFKEAYAKYLPERKKRKVSNILLVVVVVAITLYTIANMWITYTTGTSIDSTLTTCFYAFWGSEVLALTGIKLSKIKNNYESSSFGDSDLLDDEIEDEDEFDDENALG